MHLAIPSISVRILAPVVVKPDAVSNTASVKFGISPDIKNGIAPVRLIRSHVSAVTIKPSFG